MGLLTCLIGSCGTVYAAPKDIQLHWGAVAANTLLEYGVMESRGSGRFQPDHAITREEVAAALAKLSDVTEQPDEPESSENLEGLENPDSEEWKDSQKKSDGKEGIERETASGEAIEYSHGDDEDEQQNELKASEDFKDEGADFSDISGRQSEQAIRFLAGKQIIRGYPDGTFRPQAEVTREQFAVMVNNYLEWRSTAGGTDSLAYSTAAAQAMYTDMAGSFGREAVEALASQGIFSGYPDGTFRPQNPVTRAEAASVIYRISGLAPSAPEVTLPKKNVMEVPYISQVYPVSAMVGCEGTSLLMGLKSKGNAQEIGLWQFLNDMPRHESNPAKGFVGSPFQPDKTKKTRTTIDPAKLAEYGSRYGTVTDLSGSSVRELQAEVLSGNPVVVYATMNWEKPFYRTYNVEGQMKQLLSNNHVVLLCGYDSETGNYFISDPYNVKAPQQEQKYWIDRTTFEWIYNERRQAVAVE